MRPPSANARSSSAETPQNRRGVIVAGQVERFSDVREELAQHRADAVRLLRMLADSLAQEPGPVADVPCLVVVDQAVALDEAGEGARAG